MSRPVGNAAELERRRRLAVSRVVDDGESAVEVAEQLRVSRRSVDRWVMAHLNSGVAGLESKPHPGRPPKLTAEQEAQVLCWFDRSPTEFGYPNELWTGKRVVEQVRKHFKVTLHPGYILTWLAERRITPQKPKSVPRERDDAAVKRWLQTDWPRLLQKRVARTPAFT